jgi:hypothetical protein
VVEQQHLYLFQAKKKVTISVIDNNYAVIKYLIKKTNFQIIQGNCLDKNIKKIGSYDIAFSSGTFEHFNKTQSILYLKNIMKISKCGIIAVPAENILWKISSYFRLFTDKKNKSLWSNDFHYYNPSKIKKIFSTLKEYKYNIRYTYNLGIRTFLIFEFKKLK